MPKTITFEYVAVTDLTPAPWNPRTISDPRFQNLCESIAEDPEFMELRPCLANKHGIVYGGNMRFRACVHLGWPEVPAHVNDVPDVLAKARALKDNRGWGNDVQDELDAIVYELKQQGQDVNVLGFEPEEIDRMLEKIQEQHPISLDELSDQAGEPTDRDFWPRISLIVPPETHQLYQHYLSLLPGEDDSMKFAAMMRAVDEPALSLRSD